jgi:hypothetical protein
MKHPLKQWLASKKPKKLMIDFAEEVGCHPITLRRLINGEHFSHVLLEKIELATGGDLKAVDLYAFYAAQQKDGVDDLERCMSST